MSLDALKQRVSIDLQSLLQIDAILTPISSFALLAKLIALPHPSTSASALRLTDQHKLERILEDLAETWNAGTLSVLRDQSGLSLMSASLKSGRPEHRKRKRKIDEDADSAEENEEPLKSPLVKTPPSASSLSKLSKNMQEIYALLQQGTARQRLLAEQVAYCPIMYKKPLKPCTQHQSVNEAFEPICPHITKDECAKANMAEADQGDAPIASICNRVHFRPLIRQHTDPSLGHCSYLNTCYSEPTYAQSPSILPPSANVPRPTGSVALPSGLGAGGRGKEKAPCRYLHFEVDWDGGDGELPQKPVVLKKKPHKLGIGLGPEGTETSLVSASLPRIIA